MASRQRYVELARSLPPQLTRLFSRYPTPALLQGANPSPSSTESDDGPTLGATAPIASPEDANTEADKIRSSTSTVFNPFQPHRHPVTGRWHGPVFSLRRQAELVKLARKHGVEELLPYTVKSAAAKTERRDERGLRVKGTGVGQRVKGKGWERTLKPRLEKRRQAMLEMPRLIQTWKERGHGRGWKKWPK
ncbi:MAG: hypothetical protein M1833_006548 [Piccolia ochrophora]|nr:MAG: hypothetical protein M1833_006548 [Piccolia ochrophora]